MRKVPIPAIGLLCASLLLSVGVRGQCTSVVFTPKQTRPDGNSAIRHVETVDFDGDSVLDIVGLIDTTPGAGSGVLSTWKGNGDATFQAPVSLSEANVSDMELSDVNGDDRLDIITLDTSGQLLVRLGNGSGFDAPVTPNRGVSAYNFSVGRIDADNHPDLVAFSTSIQLYRGVGDGTFAPPSLIYTVTGASITTLVAADFDGDGRTDLAFGINTESRIRVLFQNADGSFTDPLVLPAVATSQPVWTTDLAATDVNNDGRPDLVSSNWEYGDDDPVASVAVFRNLGSRTFDGGTFLAPKSLHPSGAFLSIRARDLNGDGHIDLIAGGVNSSFVMDWIGNGDGTFRSPSYLEAPFAEFVTLGDFDGAAPLDLVVGGYGQLNTATGSCAPQVYLYSRSPVINPGQNAPLRALVSGINASTPLPRGTVTFREGSVSLGTAEIDATGYATIDIAGLTIGTHTLTAEFGGNSEEGSAISQNVSEEVTTIITTTTLNLPSSSVYGDPYTFSVTIGDPLGNPVYGHYVLEVDGIQSERVNYAPLTLNLAAGTHTITASFEGDIYRPPSTSGPHSFVTQKATPSITNPSGALTVRVGEAHSLQFTLAGAGVMPPSGTVQLTLGSTILGSGPVNDGVATVTATLPRGSHDVTAVYLGDSNYTTASLALTLSVLPNTSLAIDARGLTNAVSIRCVLPAGTTATALYRSPTGANTWTLVTGWTPQTEFDVVPLRGVLYDYRLDIQAGTAQTSNIDSAMLFNDDPVIARATIVKRLHLDELALAINAMRAKAVLPPFAFDATYAGPFVSASHIASLRAALTQARQALAMYPPVFSDSMTPGLTIKAIHIQELRDQAR